MKIRRGWMETPSRAHVTRRQTGGLVLRIRIALRRRPHSHRKHPALQKAPQENADPQRPATAEATGAGDGESIMFRLDKHLAVLLTASSHGLAFREVRITRHALRPADLIDDACSPLRTVEGRGTRWAKQACCPFRSLSTDHSLLPRGARTTRSRPATTRGAPGTICPSAASYLRQSCRSPWPATPSLSCATSYRAGASTCSSVPMVDGSGQG